MDVMELAASVDVGWTLVAAALVFFMQAGFAMVETGFTRAKNAGNIIMKNLMDFSLGTPIFWLVGFGIMFGTTNGLFGAIDFLRTAWSVRATTGRRSCSRPCFAPPRRRSCPALWRSAPGFPPTAFIRW